MKRSSSEIIEEINSIESKKRYEDHWKNFIEYAEIGNNEPDEDNFIQYFDYLRNTKNYAASTMWTNYSMINKMFQLKFGKKLQLYPRLKMQLKSYEKGYSRRKASIFTKEEIELFLTSAPDTDKYVYMKTAVVMCYFGGLRCADLIGINCEDLSFDESTGMWVDYKVSKQIGENVINTFNIPLEYCTYLENYDHQLYACNANNGRLMKTFRKRQNGKGYYTKQPMGIHYLRKISQDIARFLELPNPESYTGHTMRRTSATTLAETGASTSQLKKHFNWKNELTASKYIENTKGSMLKVSDSMNMRKHQFNQPQTSQSAGNPTENKTINFVNCSNVVLNF